MLEDIAKIKPYGPTKTRTSNGKLSERHPAIYQGLGGSFDVYTGRVERAPEWWVKHNLEFAYLSILPQLPPNVKISRKFAALRRKNEPRCGGAHRPVRQMRLSRASTSRPAGCRLW